MTKYRSKRAGQTTVADRVIQGLGSVGTGAAELALGGANVISTIVSYAKFKRQRSLAALTVAAKVKQQQRKRKSSGSNIESDDSDGDVNESETRPLLAGGSETGPPHHPHIGAANYLNNYNYSSLLGNNNNNNHHHHHSESDSESSNFRLQNLSFDIRPRQLTVITGCRGKSTLLKAFLNGPGARVNSGTTSTGPRCVSGANILLEAGEFQIVASDSGCNNSASTGTSSSDPHCTSQKKNLKLSSDCDPRLRFRRTNNNTQPTTTFTRNNAKSSTRGFCLPSPYSTYNNHCRPSALKPYYIPSSIPSLRLLLSEKEDFDSNPLNINPPDSDDESVEDVVEFPRSSSLKLSIA